MSAADPEGFVPSPEARSDRLASREPLGSGTDDEEVSLVALVNVLLRQRRILVGAPIVAALLLVGLGLLSQRTYTVTASFMPQTGEGRISGLAGVAAQFGIEVPRSEAGNSPLFYADLLQSRALVRSAVTSRYTVAGQGGDGAGATASLVDLYGIQSEDPGIRLAAGIRRLGADLKVSTRRETGVVDVSVKTAWPSVSQQVVERLLELVNQFNLETRQSQASAERGFIETRLEEAKRELQVAEDSLTDFLDRNRRYENLPELRFEYERLQRGVSLHQQLYVTLSQSLEQAKIDEVRNTPVITIVEPPDLPLKADSRGLARRMLLGLFLGGFVGSVWAFGRESARHTRERMPDDYEEYARLRGEAVEDLRSVWRGARRAVGRDSD